MIRGSRRRIYLAWLHALASLLAAAWRWLAIVGTVAGLAALVSIYEASQRTVNLQLNGHTYAWRTHKSAPDEVLAELPVILGPLDHVDLPSDDEMLRGRPLTFDLARRVRIVHDGTLSVFETQATTVGEALDEAGIILLPQDCVAAVGRCVPLLQRLTTDTPGDDFAEAVATWRRPIDLEVLRARQITVVDDALPVEVYTTADTVGAALAELGLTVYEGDVVYPDLDAVVLPSMRISISRSLPVAVEADGVVRAVRTRATTVGELLADEGLRLEGDDYVAPSAETPLTRNLRVSVMRVHDEYYVEEVPIAYETRWEPNSELEIDSQQVVQWGNEGARRRQVRVHFVNGQETHRVEEAEWVAREPIDRIIEYGTKIVLRELQTPTGTVTYWRKLRMLATSYNAPTAGVSRDASYYGHTRLGWRARYGIVAVDPSVIRLESKVYVPGYGEAVAADTGGAIDGRRVDLCYDDDNLVNWYKWVDVYVLTPVPSPSQINWIIPNTPKERE